MKTKHKIALAFLAITPWFVPLIFWLGGFDFNERGQTAVTCCLLTIIVTAFGSIASATFPD